MSSYKAYCGCQDTLSCLFVKTASSVFFTGFFLSVSSPCFFLSSNKKIYLLMFFHAVKFLLSCIFLENESVFHFIFLFKRSLCPYSNIVPGLQTPCNATLRETYFNILYYVIGILDRVSPILGIAG